MPKHNKISNKRISPVPSVTSVPSALPLVVLAGVAIIIVLAFFAYLPCLRGDFILDDDELLTKNELIKASDGLYRFWCTSEAADYWPVTNSSLWFEWRLWEMNPTGYHVTNLLLHIVESLLIWIILRTLSIPGAFLAAVIFAVHPVNVESVAWISQRKNTMAMLFFLLSILWFIKYSSNPSRSSRPAFYWLSLVAFVLAMLSKGSVAILPLLLLGVTWWLRPVTRWDLVRTAPFFLIAIVLTGVNVWFQTHGTGDVYRTAGFIERLLGAGGVIWFYFYKAFLPLDLAFIYPQWHIEAGNPLWWPPLIAALGVTAVLWRFMNGWSRPFLFAWGFFCVALVPVLGFTDVGFMRYSLVADHYQHIAIIALITLAAALWSTWYNQMQPTAHWAAIFVGITVIIALTVLTWRQSDLYSHKMTLYRDTLEKNPGSWVAHNNLGIALYDTGQVQMAIEHYQQALQIKPDHANAHYNLGIALFDTNQLQKAIEHYKKSLQFNPGVPEAHNNLGIALARTGYAQEAIEQYRQALKLKPNYLDAYNNLGLVLLQTDQPLKAIEIFNQALQLNPQYPDTHYNLALAMVQIGQLPSAIEHYGQALRLKPNYPQAHNNLGNALLRADRLREAISHYEQALVLKPDYIEAQNNLGAALIQADQPEQAIKYLEQSIQLKPDYINAYKNLALAYAKTGRSSEAIAIARKGIELARSKGFEAQAKQIEDWLNSYRVNTPDRPNASSP